MRSIIFLLAITAACAGTKRNAETYRLDTQRVLETRNSQITTCYEKALAADPSAGGVIAVTFVVEKKTGAFMKAAVDPAATKASDTSSAKCSK